MIDGLLEFTYRPVSKKEKGLSFFFILLLVSALIVIYSVIALRYKGLISLAAVIFMCASIYVFTRYIGVSYAYSVIYDSKDVPTFLVTQTIGKRVSTLINFPLRNIESMISEEDFKKIEERHTPVYNFTVSFMAKDVYVMTVGGLGSTKCRVRLECSYEFCERILQYSSLAKEYEREE